MSISVVQSVEPVRGKIPIFIVGAGGIVRDAHLPAYRKAGFPVAGICDLKREKSLALKNDFPEIERVYDSLAEFIGSNGGRNVVYDVAVPANELQSVLNAIPEGAAVLMQKPMGETLEEARAIVKVCAHRSFAAAVNFQLPFAPCSLAARDVIGRGLIGDLYDMEIVVCVNTPWHLWDFLKEKPRLEILYHSIHYVDLIRSFLGNPEKVYASTVKDPHMPGLASTRTAMILDYDKFTQARIITNHGHRFGPDQQQSYLKIEGTKGAIKVRIGVSLNYPAGEPDKFLLNCPETGNQWSEIALSGSWFPDAFIGTMNHVQGLATKTGTERLVTLRDNLDTMRLVEAAYQSAVSGGIRFDSVK